MAFRPYAVENLQLQLREYHAQCRAGNGDKVRWAYQHIIGELYALGRPDIIDTEERYDRIYRMGYDAEQVIADVMAGRDPLSAEQERERQRLRDLVYSEQIALLRMHVKRTMDSAVAPARAERRRTIKFKAGAMRVRRAVESAIDIQDILWSIKKVFMKNPPIDACLREIESHLHWEYGFVTIPYPPAKKNISSHS